MIDDVKQKVTAKNMEPSKGRIEIDAHQKDANNPWKERVLDELPKVIERLQDAGFEARDIAVLVRKSDEGKHQKGIKRAGFELSRRNRIDHGKTNDACLMGHFRLCPHHASSSATA